MSVQQKSTMLGNPLPNTWQEVRAPFPYQRAYLRGDGLQVIESIAPHRTPPDNDEQEWYHVSFAYPDKLPSYEDTKHVKAVFIGDAITALQVFPPKDRHVNIHETCLHLWACLEGDVTPDFGKEGTI